MTDNRRSRSRGRRGGRGSRGGPRRQGGRNPRPAKKQNPIMAFFSRLFGGQNGKGGKPSRNGTPKSGSQKKKSTVPEEKTLPEVNSTRLYVGNLSYDSSESDVFDHFAQVGQVRNVEIVRDRNNRSKGFGFVEMNSVETAKTVSEKFHRTDFQGRQIIVAGAKS